MPSDRPQLTATVNEETHDRWRRFAANCGVSISALIEAIGRSLPDDDETPADPLLRRAVIMARSIDADRRRRTPD